MEQIKDKEEFQKMSNDELFNKLPVVKKDIAIAYMENNKHIRSTMEEVLSRKLDNVEKDRLRVHSFNLAITQVQEIYKKKYNIDGLTSIEKYMDDILTKREAKSDGDNSDIKE